MDLTWTDSEVCQGSYCLVWETPRLKFAPKLLTKLAHLYGAKTYLLEYVLQRHDVYS